MAVTVCPKASVFDRLIHVLVPLLAPPCLRSFALAIVAGFLIAPCVRVDAAPPVAPQQCPPYFHVTKAGCPADHGVSLLAAGLYMARRFQGSTIDYDMETLHSTFPDTLICEEQFDQAPRTDAVRAEILKMSCGRKSESSKTRPTPSLITYRLLPASIGAIHWDVRVSYQAPAAYDVPQTVRGGITLSTMFSGGCPRKPELQTLGIYFDAGHDGGVIDAVPVFAKEWSLGAVGNRTLRLSLIDFSNNPGALCDAFIDVG